MRLNDSFISFEINIYILYVDMYVSTTNGVLFWDFTTILGRVV